MDATPQPPRPQESQALFVGIDVSSQMLDLALGESGAVTRFPNDDAGHAAVIKLLLPLNPATIVVESTGGLERPLAAALLDAGLPVALVHPGRVRSFAKGVGVLAKTDCLDARVLARFGRQAAPRLLERRSANAQQLEALVVCRRQLCFTRAQQSNRLSSTAVKPARRALEKIIAALDKQIESLEKQIRELIDADDDFKHLDGLLQGVPGVGPTLSATLTAELPELGAADGSKVCALVGVAPFNDDSGTHTGRRSIRGGRIALRCCLYMATVAAIRCNPIIKTFADRLKAAGKLPKVVIVACMRKLLTLLNAMAREGLAWNQLSVVRNLAQNT